VNVNPDPGGRLAYYWPTDEALEVLHGPDRCPTCGGREWVAVPDPLVDGALVDVRCPECAQKAKDG